MRLKGIAAVSFDVGGTLIEPWPSVGHVYAAVAEERGLGALPPEQITKQFIAAWRVRQSFDYSREAWAGLVRASLAGFCKAEEADAVFPHIYERFESAAPWRLFDDVAPALAGLQERGLRLSVTSNWDERLVPLLRALGLHDHFETCTVSREVGLHKPSRGVFHHTCDRLGLAPHQVLHIGDSTREDLDGALAAGLKGLRIDRSAPAANEQTLTSLTQLLE